MNSYKNLTDNKTKKLSETAQDLFYLLHSFGKNCGPCQLYFYEKKFFPTKTTKYTNQKTKELCSWDITQLLTTLFTLNPWKQWTNNKRVHKKTTNKHDMTYINCPVPINNPGLTKILDFGQV